MNLGGGCGAGAHRTRSALSAFWISSAFSCKKLTLIDTEIHTLIENDQNRGGVQGQGEAGGERNLLRAGLGGAQARRVLPVKPRELRLARRLALPQLDVLLRQRRQLRLPRRRRRAVSGGGGGAGGGGRGA